MDNIQKLIDEGVIVSKEYFTDRIDEDLETGEQKKVRSYYTKYYDTRKFVKTFNPVINRLVKDYEGNPKAQIMFILMSALEDNREVTDIDFGFKEFSKLCKKHEVKIWTRPQLSVCLKWLVDKGYITKVEGSIFRVNYRFFYNGSILNPLGLNKPIEKKSVRVDRANPNDSRMSLTVSIANLSDEELEGEE